MRPIDAEVLYGVEALLSTDIVQNSKEASWLLSQVLHDIQASPTIDPEKLPVVRELREKVKALQKELDEWEYWMGYCRRVEAESARKDRAAVKVIQKRCEQTIEELREQLAKVTAERDAAVEDLSRRPHRTTCKHGKYCDFINVITGAPDCFRCDEWEWRGPQKEE